MIINILDYLHDSTLKNPTQVAFSDMRMSISYNDLYNISKKNRYLSSYTYEHK